MIGSRSGGPGPAELSALLRLVEFALAVNKDPDKIRSAIEEVAVAKEETLAILSHRQAELDALKQAVDEQTARNAGVSAQLAADRRQYEADVVRFAKEVELKRDDLQSRAAIAEKRAAELDARERAILDREAGLSESESKLLERNRSEALAHKAKMAEVAQLRESVAAQKAALDEATARAEEKVKEYETKLSALKAMVGA